MLLINVLDTHLEKQKHLLVSAASSSISENKDKKKSPEKELEVWHSWLKLLKMQLTIEGYVDRFVNDLDCKAMLFRFVLT
jgi:hypothetical protein